MTMSWDDCDLRKSYRSLLLVSGSMSPPSYLLGLRLPSTSAGGQGQVTVRINQRKDYKIVSANTCPHGRMRSQ